MYTIRPAPTRPAPSPSGGSDGEPPRTLATRLFEGKRWILVRLLSDGLFLGLAVLAGIYGSPAPIGAAGAGLIALFGPLVLILLALRGLYGTGLQTDISQTLRKVIGVTSLAAMSLITVAALADVGQEGLVGLARTWLFATLYLSGSRLVLTLSHRRAKRRRVVGKPTLIVGAGRIASRVERRLEHQPELGLRPVGYLDADPPPQEYVPSRHAPVLGSPSELGRIADETGARHVILAFLSESDQALLPLVRECEERGIEVSVVPRLFDIVNVRVGLEHLGGLPLYGLRSLDPEGWLFTVKHGLDRILAAALLLVTSPLVLSCALAVKLSSPGPVLFSQRRIGRDGRQFEMLKFRSMRVGEEDPPPDATLIAALDRAPGGVEGGDRRTRAGSFLRRTSLDELPQLFNVLKGEMSIVGPRPERPEFVEAFGQSIGRYDDRHRVRSGMTGWAQVHGFRGQTSLADRVEWDNYYIANWSLWLDLKIMLLTLAVVLRRAE